MEEFKDKQSIEGLIWAALQRATKEKPNTRFFSPNRLRNWAGTIQEEGRFPDIEIELTVQIFRAMSRIKDRIMRQNPPGLILTIREKAKTQEANDSRIAGWKIAKRGDPEDLTLALKESNYLDTRADCFRAASTLFNETAANGHILPDFKKSKELSN